MAVHCIESAVRPTFRVASRLGMESTEPSGAGASSIYFVLVTSHAMASEVGPPRTIDEESATQRHWMSPQELGLT